jgi:hypothetical protein
MKLNSILYKTITLLMLIGSGLVIVSLFMEPFYYSFEIDLYNSTHYYESRSDALTPKYNLQDYGITLMCIAAVLLLYRLINGFKAPSSWIGFVLIAIAAPTLLTVAGVFSLIQDMERREFSPWADSIGIPLMGMPVIFVCSLIWSIIHLGFLIKIPLRKNIAINTFSIRNANPWLLLVSILTSVLLFESAISGDYSYMLSLAVSLYFYLSLLFVRQHAINMNLKHKVL